VLCFSGDAIEEDDGYGEEGEEADEVMFTNEQMILCITH
jgi:hypothetical protein